MIHYIYTILCVTVSVRGRTYACVKNLFEESFLCMLNVTLYACNAQYSAYSIVQCSEGNEGIAGTGVAAAGARARRAALRRTTTAL